MCKRLFKTEQNINSKFIQSLTSCQKGETKSIEIAFENLGKECNCSNRANAHFCRKQHKYTRRGIKNLIFVVENKYNSIMHQMCSKMETTA